MQSFKWAVVAAVFAILAFPVAVWAAPGSGC